MMSYVATVVVSGILAAPPQAVGTGVASSAGEQVTAAAAPDAERESQAVVLSESGGIRVWHPASVRDGRLLVLEVDGGAGCDEPRVRWLGTWFATYRVGERRQALLPTLLGASGDAPLRVECGRRVGAFTVALFEGSYPESRLSVDPKFTRTPPRRVVGERRAIAEALRTRSVGRLWSDPFIRPSSAVVTSPFGVRRTFNGKLQSRHRGIDLDGKVGDPLVAANDGTVVLAADDYYYTGSAVFIDHGDQLFTMYFHLSRLDVATGEKVERGQVIGALGKSGRVTGPHVHFAVKLAGIYVDPEDLWSFQPGLLASEMLTDRP